MQKRKASANSQNFHSRKKQEQRKGCNAGINGSSGGINGGRPRADGKPKLVAPYDSSAPDFRSTHV
eukprot:1960201-Rhodomonas_salina.1